jgi:hypothetical protein
MTAQHRLNACGGHSAGAPSSTQRNCSTDLPDGLFGEIAVQPRLQKYFASRFGRNSFIDSHIPHPQEGRIAIVTDVGRGMRWTRQYRKTGEADRGRRSRVVLTPRRWRQVFAGSVPRKRRWQESPVTGESTKETVKTIA